MPCLCGVSCRVGQLCVVWAQERMQCACTVQQHGAARIACLCGRKQQPSVWLPVCGVVASSDLQLIFLGVCQIVLWRYSVCGGCAQGATFSCVCHTVHCVHAPDKLNECRESFLWPSATSLWPCQLGVATRSGTCCCCLTLLSQPLHNISCWSSYGGDVLGRLARAVAHPAAPIFL
jgi:hypothetical protein